MPRHRLLDAAAVEVLDAANHDGGMVDGLNLGRCMQLIVFLHVSCLLWGDDALADGLQAAVKDSMRSARAPAAQAALATAAAPAPGCVFATSRCLEHAYAGVMDTSTAA